MLPPQKPTTYEQQIISLGCVLQSLRQEDNVDVLIETIISYLQEQFDHSLIWIALYDQLNHVLLGKGGITPSKDTRFLKQKVVLQPGDLLEQVVIEQRSISVADLRDEIRVHRWQEVAAKFNIQGTMVVPISYKDRCLGVVLLGSERWGYIVAGEAKARLMMVLGELGAVLFQIEEDLQHRQIKRLDEPLLQLLENLQTLNNLEQKLEAVLSATHEFVSPTRTSLYWFEREKHQFWLRLSYQKLNQGKTHSDRQGVSEISVQELNDFYYALSVNQVVLIGEEYSSLKSNFTGQLLQRLQVRSLLAAPIIWQKNLLGFLTIQTKEARIWTEAEQNFVKGAAGFISIASPTDDMEMTIKQIQEDCQLQSQVAKAIYREDDNLEIFRICAAKVLERFKVTRFFLLYYDSDQSKYYFLYQSQLQKRRPLASTLDALTQLDGQLLQRSTQGVGIDNLEEDLRFFNWHPVLMENGVQSLLISNCAQNRPPETLLLITDEAHRYWTTQEKELLHVIAQQIGVIVRQWQLHHQTEQQQKILRSFRQCLRILEKNQSTDTQIQELESSVLQEIASVLGCPLVLLLSWIPEQSMAEIIPGVIADSRFAVVTDAPISIQTESLIQWALATDGLLPLQRDDLPEQTRKWLNGSDIGQILVMALRTSAEYESTGIVLMADRLERQWSEQSLIAVETLICQFAWFRRHLQITQIFHSHTDKLRQLNWYKHRRVEDSQRTLVQLLSQMYTLGIPTHELTQARYQQLLHQLDNTTASMTAMLKLEQWQLHINTETIPIASLLKRSLERVENLLKQHKLWVGVHGLGQQVVEKTDALPNPEGLKPQSMAIVGDVVKIELVLYELLMAACHRSTTGGRIDIWCRRLDEHSLEVSITDNGNLDPQILTLNQETQKDFLAPSSLKPSPDLHLLICQNLIQQLGGELDFYQLPDYRVVSRLLLPLVE